MSFDKTSLVRQLIPKSYHFDGYNKLNCPNPRDKPFFSDNVIAMGKYYLTIRMVNPNMISIEYSSVCTNGKIIFRPYTLSLESYVSELKKAIQDNSDFITFNIQPEYNHDFDSCNHCLDKNEDCVQIRKRLPKMTLAAISFNLLDIKEALSTYFEISNQQPIIGGISMKNKNNIFGMNFELGISKDTNISATLMGLAVKNSETGNWYTFDPLKNTRKNITNMTMGNFPIFLLPTKKLDNGDLVKMDGKYYYVKSINSNNTITLLGASDGIIREMLPEESIIPGMTIYTKVVAFDTKSLIDTSSKENMSSNVLAAMCMMQWTNNNQDEFSLDNINDDSFNGLGSCLPMIMAMNGGDIGGIFSGNTDGGINLPMLMMMGSNSGSNDTNGMTQMLVLSQLLGNNNSSFPNIINPPATTGTSAAEGKVICEKCDIEYPKGTKFCPKCGIKTKDLSITCLDCGTALMPGALFCHNCGSKVSKDVCPSCQKHISSNENFCSNCGTSLIENRTSVSQPEKTHETDTVTTSEA